MDNLLKRLRELRAQECCRHIDQQVKLWLDQQQPQPHHNYPNHNHHHNHHHHQQHHLQITNNIRPPQLQLPPPPQLQDTLSPHLLATTTTTTTTATTTISTPTPTPTITATTTHNNTDHDITITTSTNTRSVSPPPLPLIAVAPEKLHDSDEKTIGFFLANLKHLESLDSDATESTSSNDSFDELEGFSQEDIPPRRNIPTYKSPHNYGSVSSTSRRTSHLQSLDTPSSSHINSINGNLTHMADLKKKSIWKWAKERSRLASKWTWLQAQIADLEFRVRGQNDAFVQARHRKLPPLPQTLPESSCSRTVPLSKDFRNRSLIKSTQILSDSSKSSVKFSHVPCVCSSLPQTVAPCLSCKGRYNYLRQLEGENAPLLERAALIDPGCHPVLSFPDDITLGSQISYLLKQETVNRKPVKGKPGRKKGSTAAALAAISSANEDKKNAKLAAKKGKFYQGMSNRAANHAQGGHLKNPSQTMIASNKLKRKYRKHSNNPNNYDSNNWFGTNNHAHSNNCNNSNYNNSTKRNKRIRSASSMNESSLHSDSSNPYRPNHFSNNNATARGVTRRRRSEQSAYDIDNIVIPFSVAATTRVEILEYKEIMTPSWRVWENGTCVNDNSVHAEREEEDVEDTSDDAYIMRHTKGEHEEKKRFSLKPPPKNEIQNAAPTTG